MTFLFADTEPATGLAAVGDFLRENWLLLMPAVLGFTAIYLLLPKARRITPIAGGLLGIAALVLAARALGRADTYIVETVLFFAFSGLAIGSGVMMITQSNPVHAALSFALVILSTCGLFLLLAAPFLMAATIIVYAGAIVVTFLFVIMLAQQEGASNADQRSREPFLASLAGCILLASLTCILHKSYDARDLDQPIAELSKLMNAKDVAEVKQIMGDPAAFEATDLRSELSKTLLKRFPEEMRIHDMNLRWVKLRNDSKKDFDELKSIARQVHDAIEAKQRRKGTLALDNVPGKPNNKTPSHFAPGKLPASNVAALGGTLFTDYLVPVELAAVLLLVATIGAIAIAGRRGEELR